MPAKKTRRLRKWKLKEKIAKEGDAMMKGGRDTDIVILCALHIFQPFPRLTNDYSVMGPTGVGKSTVRTFGASVYIVL
jgi:hypothetical protein